jgi:hypothetical protein
VSNTSGEESFKWEIKVQTNMNERDNREDTVGSRKKAWRDLGWRKRRKHTFVYYIQ